MVTTNSQETTELLVLLFYLSLNKTGMWINPDILITKHFHQRVEYVLGSKITAKYSEMAKFLVIDFHRKMHLLTTGI